MKHDLFLNWQVYDESGRRKYLSEAERLRFLAAADRQHGDIRALCHVLAYTGCRISEALALQRHHLDDEQLAITLRTLKRRRLVFRRIPIPRSLVAQLDALPVHEHGQYWPMHRITAWRHVKQVMLNAGIRGPHATARGLRHGFGIWAAAASTPPNLIQRWMGHASPTTTAIYLNAVGDEERAFARRMWNREDRREMRLAA